ncbi:hypothetical protein CCHR01_08457 [Colletotrichum chrysophilum]|uniref:Uncharacterized protein n=1 Tax=Colletotrichum chrysophilum TaxID=1836956 RepID=A0AAD9AIU4_9PEZI|nr:hypothetical protein CCHR01_08457 [Colletotrichum chrysophilum]
MVKVGRTKGEVIDVATHILWTDGPLRTLIHNHFVKDIIMNPEDIKLPRSFNAWSLDAIGGIRFEPTDNLASHLLLSEDDTGDMTVCVFHHVSFLKDMTHSVYPEGLVQETLDTLALLYPQSLFGVNCCRTRSLRFCVEKLDTGDHPLVIDHRLGCCGTLKSERRRLGNFRYWRKRLTILKQAYDEATPKTLTQFWHDRRNWVVWWTFWLAAVILALTLASLVIGVIQCVLSGLQLLKS